MKIYAMIIAEHEIRRHIMKICLIQIKEEVAERSTVRTHRNVEKHIHQTSQICYRPKPLAV